MICPFFLFFLLQCEMNVDVVFIKGIEHSGFTFEIMHRQKLRFDLSLNLIIIWIIYMREYACQLKHSVHSSALWAFTTHTKTGADWNLNSTPTFSSSVFCLFTCSVAYFVVSVLRIVYIKSVISNIKIVKWEKKQIKKVLTVSNSHIEVQKLQCHQQISFFFFI